MSNRNRNTLVAVVMVVAMLTAVRAQQPASNAGSTTPTKLTAEDYAELSQLYARYTYAFDSGNNEGKDWSDTFTPDGMFTNAAGGQFLKGSVMIAAFGRGRLQIQRPYYSLDMTPGTNKPPVSVGHILTNFLFTPTAEGLVGKAMRITNTGVPNGIYFDLLVKTPDGWRYKEKYFIGANLPVPEGAERFITPSQPKPNGNASIAN
jgi:hypothetical protein